MRFIAALVMLAGGTAAVCEQALVLMAQPAPVSRTAVVAASLRAIGSKHPDSAFRNPDHLAIRLIGSQERALLTDIPADALDLGYAEALERLSAQDRASVTSMFIRTTHLDAALDEALGGGATQVVILGAGFDSRGYRFSDRLQHARLIEVDAGPTQDYKKQRVREVLGRLPAHVRYVPMDFTKDDLLTELGKAGYSEKERSLYIWEGVTMYLPESAVTSTLHFIRDHAAPGSRVVFDYTLASDQRVNNSSTRFAKLGEPWLFGFPGASAVEFLRRAGLDTVTDLSYAELAARYARRPDGTSPLPALAADQNIRRIAVAEVPANISAQSASPANDPMDGTWDLDVAVSRFNPGPARKSDTRTYKVEGNSIRMRATSVFADGRSENIQFDAALDGKDYPAAGNPRVETIAQTRVDAYTIKTTTKRGGKVAATSTRQVSKDGGTMTIHTTGTDENGVAFENTLVFRKRRR